MHGVTNLVDVPMGVKSVDVESFSDHMKEVHDYVKRQLEKSNVSYKLRADRKT